jgi:hypothetical protein
LTGGVLDCRATDVDDPTKGYPEYGGEKLWTVMPAAAIL